MTGYEIAFGAVAYISVVVAFLAWMGALDWRDQVVELQARIDARAALCRDRRCQLVFDPAPEPIPFFPPERPRRRPQETSTPG